MKHITLLAALYLFIIPAKAQNDSVVFSQLENFVMTPGRSVQVKTATLGALNNLDIGLLIATTVSGNEKRKAICFKPRGLFDDGWFSVQNLHIDTEETDSLVSFLRLAKAQSAQKPGSGPVYLQYTTQNLIVFTLENRVNNPDKWDLTIYKRNKYFNTPLYGSSLFCRGKEIGDLLEILLRYQAFPSRFD